MGGSWCRGHGYARALRGAKLLSTRSERNRTLHNFDHKLSTRLDNPKTGVIVIIAQRLHTRDLTGHLVDGPDAKRWVHLCIPMEAPERKTYLYFYHALTFGYLAGEIVRRVSGKTVHVESSTYHRDG
jgi:hypothetical protein